MSATDAGEPGDARVIDWLLEGDPVIRWQVMRDLLDEPETVWKAERAKVVESGWVADILGRQLPDASWPAGRWTDTVWTLLVLLDCGLTGPVPRVRDAADRLISSLLPAGFAVKPGILKTRQDLCHVGFWLRIGSAFLPGDERLALLAQTIFDLQLADGGWNCRIRNYPDTTHSSFHTTFNVLEGLRQAAESAATGETPALDQKKYKRAEAAALEFMLAHRMYKSDKSGEIVDERLTRLTFPSYWHYTVLRGLDYMRHNNEIADPRLDDAVELLRAARRDNGRWPVEGRIPGVTFFDMEKPGTDSRWNTLRALRVLRARAGPSNPAK